MENEMKSSISKTAESVGDEVLSNAKHKRRSNRIKNLQNADIDLESPLKLPTTQSKHDKVSEHSSNDAEHFLCDLPDQRSSIFESESENELEKEESMSQTSESSGIMFDDVFQQNCTAGQNVLNIDSSPSGTKFFKKYTSPKKRSSESRANTSRLETDNVSKVFKLLTTPNSNNMSSDGKSVLRSPLKTYGNPRKSLEKNDIIETFGLPDTPIIPEKPLVDSILDAEILDAKEITLQDLQFVQEPWCIIDLEENFSDLQEIRIKANPQNHVKICYSSNPSQELENNDFISASSSTKLQSNLENVSLAAGVRRSSNEHNLNDKKNKRSSINKGFNLPSKTEVIIENNSLTLEGHEVEIFNSSSFHYLANSRPTTAVKTNKLPQTADKDRTFNSEDQTAQNKDNFREKRNLRSSSVSHSTLSNVEYPRLNILSDETSNHIINSNKRRTLRSSSISLDIESILNDDKTNSSNSNKKERILRSSGGAGRHSDFSGLQSYCTNSSSEKLTTSGKNNKHLSQLHLKIEIESNAINMPKRILRSSSCSDLSKEIKTIKEAKSPKKTKNMLNISNDKQTQDKCKFNSSLKKANSDSLLQVPTSDKKRENKNRPTSTAPEKDHSKQLTIVLHPLKKSTKPRSKRQQNIENSDDDKKRLTRSFNKIQKSFDENAEKSGSSSTPREMLLELVDIIPISDKPKDSKLLQSKPFLNLFKISDDALSQKLLNKNENKKAVKVARKPESKYSALKQNTKSDENNSCFTSISSPQKTDKDDGNIESCESVSKIIDPERISNSNKKIDKNDPSLRDVERESGKFTSHELLNRIENKATTKPEIKSIASKEKTRLDEKNSSLITICSSQKILRSNEKVNKNNQTLLKHIDTGRTESLLHVLLHKNENKKTKSDIKPISPQQNSKLDEKHNHLVHQITLRSNENDQIKQDVITEGSHTVPETLNKKVDRLSSKPEIKNTDSNEKTKLDEKNCGLESSSPSQMILRSNEKINRNDQTQNGNDDTDGQKSLCMVLTGNENEQNTNLTTKPIPKQNRKLDKKNSNLTSQKTVSSNEKINKNDQTQFTNSHGKSDEFIPQTLSKKDNEKVQGVTTNPETKISIQKNITEEENKSSTSRKAFQSNNKQINKSNQTQTENSCIESGDFEPHILTKSSNIQTDAATKESSNTNKTDSKQHKLDEINISVASTPAPNTADSNGKIDGSDQIQSKDSDPKDTKTSTSVNSNLDNSVGTNSKSDVTVKKNEELLVTSNLDDLTGTKSKSDEVAEKEKELLPSSLSEVNDVQYKTKDYVSVDKKSGDFKDIYKSPNKNDNSLTRSKSFSKPKRSPEAAAEMMELKDLIKKINESEGRRCKVLTNEKLTECLKTRQYNKKSQYIDISPIDSSKLSEPKEKEEAKHNETNKTLDHSHENVSPMKSATDKLRDRTKKIIEMLSEEDTLSDNQDKECISSRKDPSDQSRINEKLSNNSNATKMLTPAIENVPFVKNDDNSSPIKIDNQPTCTHIDKIKSNKFKAVENKTIQPKEPCVFSDESKSDNFILSGIKNDIQTNTDSAEERESDLPIKKLTSNSMKNMEKKVDTIPEKSEVNDQMNDIQTEVNTSKVVNSYVENNFIGDEYLEQSDDCKKCDSTSYKRLTRNSMKIPETQKVDTVLENNEIKTSEKNYRVKDNIHTGLNSDQGHVRKVVSKENEENTKGNISPSKKERGRSRKSLSVQKDGNALTSIHKLNSVESIDGTSKINENSEKSKTLQNVEGSIVESSDVCDLLMNISVSTTNGESKLKSDENVINEANLNINSSTLTDVTFQSIENKSEDQLIPNATPLLRKSRGRPKKNSPLAKEHDSIVNMDSNTNKDHHRNSEVNQTDIQVTDSMGLNSQITEISVIELQNEHTISKNNNKDSNADDGDFSKNINNNKTTCSTVSLTEKEQTSLENAALKDNFLETEISAKNKNIDKIDQNIKDSSIVNRRNSLDDEVSTINESINAEDDGSDNLKYYFTPTSEKSRSKTSMDERLSLNDNDKSPKSRSKTSLAHRRNSSIDKIENDLSNDHISNKSNSKTSPSKRFSNFEEVLPKKILRERTTRSDEKLDQDKQNSPSSRTRSKSSIGRRISGSDIEDIALSRRIRSKTSLGERITSKDLDYVHNTDSEDENDENISTRTRSKTSIGERIDGDDKEDYVKVTRSKTSLGGRISDEHNTAESPKAAKNQFSRMSEGVSLDKKEHRQTRSISNDKRAGEDTDSFKKVDQSDAINRLRSRHSLIDVKKKVDVNIERKRSRSVAATHKYKEETKKREQPSSSEVVNNTADASTDVKTSRRNYSLETKKDLETYRKKILKNPKLGHIAWAQIGKFPYWPSLISKEPATGEFKKLVKKKFGDRTMYHVRFFGDKGRRAWISCKKLLEFKDKNDLEEIYNNTKESKHLPEIRGCYIKSYMAKKWTAAVEEVEYVKEQNFTFNQKVKYLEAIQPLAEDGVDSEVEDSSLKRNSSKKKENAEAASSSKKISPTKHKTADSLDDSDEEENFQPSKKKIKLSVKDAPTTSKEKPPKRTSTNVGPSEVSPNLQKENKQEGSTSNDNAKIEEEITVKDEYSDTEFKMKLNTFRNFGSYSIEEQRALFKRNTLFKGVPKEKVCQYCFGFGDILKCKGGCNGIYHAYCAAQVLVEKFPKRSKIRKSYLKSEGVVEKVEVKKPEVNKTEKSEPLTSSGSQSEVDESHVQIVTIPSSIYNTPPRKTFPPDFMNMSLGERIDFKMKEIMRKFESTSYTEMLVESSSSEEKRIANTKQVVNSLSSKCQDLFSASPQQNQELCKELDTLLKSDLTTVSLRQNLENTVLNTLKHANLDSSALLPRSDSGANQKREESPAGKDPKSEVTEHVTAVTEPTSGSSNKNFLPNKKIQKRRRYRPSAIEHVTADCPSPVSSVAEHKDVPTFSNGPIETKAFNGYRRSLTKQVTAEHDNSETIDSESLRSTSSRQSKHSVDSESLRSNSSRQSKQSEVSDILEAYKNVNPKHFKCGFCTDDIDPYCFICNELVSKKGFTIRHKCSLYQCSRFYHPDCLKLWPQTQWSLIQTTKNRYSQEEIDSFVCPQHVCHTCASDDPRASTARCSGDKIVKCLRCPASYHSTNLCVPAGTEILTSTQIVCPRHRNKNIKQYTINTTWCLLCNEGGNLICCETCPTSVHPECMTVSLTDDDRFICEDCESGRLPLHDEVVWVKLGHYRWWPSLILFPNEVPPKVSSSKHSPGEFVVKFFGTYDYYWMNRGRAFLFQEGDTLDTGVNTKKRVEAAFIKAVEEAVVAHKMKKQFKLTQLAECANSLKPPPYIKIKVSKPVGNVRLTELDLSNTTACDCDPRQRNPCGPDSNCLNRLLLTECNPEVCPAGHRCKNQSFEKREYPTLVPYKTETRGWGLKTLDPVKKGQFVIEYVGELIDDEEYQRRIQKMHEQKEENYYFLTIYKDRMIDAGPKGNMARFMNHCCQPNCETQKWTVNGDTRVGLFATEDIPAETELTFNYNLECTGTEKKVCKCGAPNCNGFIGVKTKNDSTEPKKPKKEKKKKEPEKPVILPPCFLCQKKGGNISLCNNKICNKSYHLRCLKLTEWPEGKKFVCPWHYCNTCSKRTIRCCVKCLNSFCPPHSEGNVRYDNLMGFVCSVHDPTNSQSQNSNVTVRKRRSNITSDEAVVTSTTDDNDDDIDDVSLLQRHRKLKKNKKNALIEVDTDELNVNVSTSSLVTNGEDESQDETVSSATASDFEEELRPKRKKPSKKRLLTKKIKLKVKNKNENIHKKIITATNVNDSSSNTTR